MFTKCAVRHMSFKMSSLQQVLQKLADKRNCRHTLIGSIQQNESKCADHCPGFGLGLCNGFSAVDSFSAPSPSKIWPEKTSSSVFTHNKVSSFWPCSAAATNCFLAFFYLVLYHWKLELRQFIYLLISGCIFASKNVKRTRRMWR